MARTRKTIESTIQLRETVAAATVIAKQCGKDIFVVRRYCSNNYIVTDETSGKSEVLREGYRVGRDGSITAAPGFPAPELLFVSNRKDDHATQV